MGRFNWAGGGQQSSPVRQGTAERVARLVVDADQKHEGRQIVAAEVQSLAVGIVGQGVFLRGFILKVADSGFFHFVNGRDGPKPIIARCIPTVVGVADDAGAVSGIAAIEVGRMS